MSADPLALRGPTPAVKPRRISVLGATGSVGLSTLDLIGRGGEAYAVEALTAYANVAELAQLAKRFRARRAVIGDPARYAALREALAGSGIEAAAGPAALVEAAEMPADWVMAAIVGAAGLDPTLAAVRRGAVVALANKEALVCAGDLVMREVKRRGATLLPVDSEHNAIFQVFDFARPESVDRLILTASGGPFRNATPDEMARATPAEAVAHPNWRMGAKISVDSATMMNKGLEVIEASHLFPIAQDRLEVLIHPQSVVHSLVSYIDGSVLAQLGSADMRTPIAYALAWPGRIDTPSPKLDLAAMGTLNFEAPDPVRFPALGLARAALAAGGLVPTALNAANEVAVAAFLAGRIGFLDIAGVVADSLAGTDVGTAAVDNLDAVRHADQSARRIAGDLVARRTGKGV